jgi:hypothetical protein
MFKMLVVDSNLQIGFSARPLMTSSPGMPQGFAADEISGA